MIPSALACIGRLGELCVISGVTEDPRTLRREVVLDPEAETPAALERQPRAYAWPTWAHDDDAILVSSLEYPAPGEPPARVLRVSGAERQIQVLYRNPESSGLIGPGLPHYLNPSPDGNHLLVLAQTPPGGLSLLYVDAKGRGPAIGVTRGQPLFTAWAPDSDAVLLHVGGELSLMELTSAPATQILATNHVGYRVPSWAPDGKRIALAANQGTRNSLVVMDRGGRVLSSLAPSWPSAVVAWSPDGGCVAQAQMTGMDPPRYANLQLVDAGGDGIRASYTGHFRACCWSPDGTRLALLTPGTRPRVSSWVVVDRDGAIVRRFPQFLPSAELEVYVSFFDQYVLSHRLWSPDGAMLLAAGRMQQNGTPIEYGGPSVYCLSVADGAVRIAGAGTMAVWGPEPATDGGEV